MTSDEMDRPPVNLEGDRFDTWAANVVEPMGLKLTRAQAAKLCDAVSVALRVADKYARKEGYRAGLEEAAKVADAHRSKVAINEPLWHDGQDWAAQRIGEAVRALQKEAAQKAVVTTYPACNSEP